MPKFAIQNTEAKVSTRDIKYAASTPNAFVIATNFSSPYVLTCTANDPEDIYCDNILNQNNFFNPGSLVPQISGNYLVRWSFSCLVASGSSGQTYTATIQSPINTETFNFIPSSTVTTSQIFHTIISSPGFSIGDFDTSIQFTITSPENSTLNLTSNIINIKYISALTELPL
jgi:hypothetical protein